MTIDFWNGIKKFIRQSRYFIICNTNKNNINNNKRSSRSKIIVSICCIGIYYIGICIIIHQLINVRLNVLYIFIHNDLIITGKKKETQSLR